MSRWSHGLPRALLAAVSFTAALVLAVPGGHPPWAGAPAWRAAYARVVPAVQEDLSAALGPAVRAQAPRSPRRSAGPSTWTAKPKSVPYVMVVVMHDVAPAGSGRSDALSVTPAHLATELEYLKAHGWRTLTPGQLYEYMRGRLGITHPSILLTFDDGLEGVYTYALPLFERFHMRFTVFAIASRTRETRPLSGPGRAYMTWGELKAMRATGLVSVEAHTYGLHHTDFVRPGEKGPAVYPRYLPNRRRFETAAQYTSRLGFDFAKERSLFKKHLGYVPQFLAWPFGVSTPLALVEARRFGIKGFFTVTPGLAISGGNVLAIPRIGLSQMDEHLAGAASHWRRVAQLAIKRGD